MPTTASTASRPICCEPEPEVCRYLRREGSQLLRAYFRRRTEAWVAEDLAQESLLKAWQHCEDVEEPQRARAWLFGIARRQLVDHYRREARLPERVEPSGLGHLESPGRDALPFRAEMANFMRARLTELPPEQQEVVAALLEGERQVDIAERLQIPLPTVKARAQRGRLRLLELAEQRCIFIRDAFGRVVDCEPRREPGCCA